MAGDYFELEELAGDGGIAGAHAAVAGGGLRVGGEVALTPAGGGFGLSLSLPWFIEEHWRSRGTLHSTLGG